VFVVATSSDEQLLEIMFTGNTDPNPALKRRRRDPPSSDCGAAGKTARQVE
jgi:hypothetical protein